MVEIEDEINTLEPYINGFAAGTISVKEAFARLCQLAKLGSAVETLKQEHGENRIRFAKAVSDLMYADQHIGGLGTCGTPHADRPCPNDAH